MKKATGRALLFDGVPGTLRLENREIPVPGPGEVLACVTASTICGSDLHTIKGRRQVAVPTILGHEIIGVIAEFGAGADRKDLEGNILKPGDRVTWAIVGNCGHCAPCVSDMPQKCAAGFKYGHELDREGARWAGGFAEWCLLAPGTAMVRLPESMPDELACPVSCATATVCAAMEAAGPAKGKRILVAGAGLLGLTACAMAATRGAGSVTCVEIDGHRRQRALEFGASQAMIPEPGFAGEFDIFLELSGSNAAWEWAFDRLALGGRAVLVGSVFPAPDTRISLERVVRRLIGIRGIHNYAPRHLLEAVRFLEACGNRFPFAGMVDGWHDLADHAMALRAATMPGAGRVGFRMA